MFLKLYFSLYFNAFKEIETHSAQINSKSAQIVNSPSVLPDNIRIKLLEDTLKSSVNGIRPNLHNEARTLPAVVHSTKPIAHDACKTPVSVKIHNSNQSRLVMQGPPSNENRSPLNTTTKVHSNQVQKVNALVKPTIATPTNVTVLKENHQNQQKTNEHAQKPSTTPQINPIRNKIFKSTAGLNTISAYVSRIPGASPQPSTNVPKKQAETPENTCTMPNKLIQQQPCLSTNLLKDNQNEAMQISANIISSTVATPPMTLARNASLKDSCTQTDPVSVYNPPTLRYLAMKHQNPLLKNPLLLNQLKHYVNMIELILNSGETN